MSRFIGRERDIAALNALLQRQEAQLVLVDGRRRSGKTTLLLEWAKQSGREKIYWVAARDVAAQLRQGLMAEVWSWAYPGSGETPKLAFDTWQGVFDTIARMIDDKPVILILDEFSYAAESDHSLASYLQAAWDHQFKEHKNLIVALAGSHIGMMSSLMQEQAPLYGRVTAHLRVEPLPFAAVRGFLPQYPTADRVAVWAVVGGIPAYLERFSGDRTVADNLRELFMQRTGMFRAEPLVLVGDVIGRNRETYEAVLRAIAAGRRTPTEIGQALKQTAGYLGPYLKNLSDLHLIERRLPVTVPLERHGTSRSGRYHLSDPYLRFFFRFIAPNMNLVEQQLDVLLWERIREQFRSYVGEAFEDLCQEWVLAQARENNLPFMPELVGSHWAPDAQVDVVAINHGEKSILLGECKWGTGGVGRAEVRELVEKAALVVPGADWKVSYVLFSRYGFTDAAQAEATGVQAQLVDLDRIDADLMAAQNKELA